MRRNHNEIIPVNNTPVPSIPENLEVNTDKLGRPYAKIKDNKGNYYKQEKLLNKKVKRTIVSDK